MHCSVINHNNDDNNNNNDDNNNNNDNHNNNKGIGDAGSTADFRMLWSAIVCLGLL